MTKEKFINSDREYYICRICKSKIKKQYIPYNHAMDSGMSSSCRMCDYLARHKDIELLENWNYEEYKNVIYQIFNEGKEFINDIIIDNKTLSDVVAFISSLHINGVKLKVHVNCAVCNEKITCYPTKYLNNQNIFCCREHYNQYRKEHTLKGKESSFYKRITTFCDNCNKKIDVIPYKYNARNSFGDNHNFCSKKCYWEYRSKYYVGDKSVSSRREYTEEQRNNARIKALENSRKASRFDSDIQLKINSVLDELNIKYEREHIMGYYATDNYLLDSNLIIEVMGDYWHGNPIMYNKNKYMLNNIQDRGIHTDKTKHSYIKNHYNIEILYLWESDINNDIEKCKQLILSYISQSGNLENYHSFNYSYQNNQLILNNTLIIPYQNIPKKEYIEVIKKSV